jgi:hypothetical protein
MMYLIPSRLPFPFREIYLLLILSCPAMPGCRLPGADYRSFENSHTVEFSHPGQPRSTLPTSESRESFVDFSQNKPESKQESLSVNRQDNVNKPLVTLIGLESEEEDSAWADRDLVFENEQRPDNSCLPPLLTWNQDRKRIFSRLRHDARGVVNRDNAIILGAVLGGAIALRQDINNEIRDNTSRHPERWGQFSNSLGELGEVQVQIPALLSLYGYSLYRQDEELHDLSGSLISTFTIAGLATISIKGIANTDRPSDRWNGGQFGFPSYHTSSSFAMAAVLDEYYGHRAGLPAYTVAGLIGWSRIDERDHDLSDVVFGAALGYVIGKSVAKNHLCKDSRVRIFPYTHPTDGSSGVMLDIPY